VDGSGPFVRLSRDLFPQYIEEHVSRLSFDPGFVAATLEKDKAEAV
jgi:hypothetical protein